ncbi:MAG TPA: hypothetical protein VM370_06405 [Candidatus Thermoplasmatota archaeon]|nr:hypothetical protein [Candidatus Thermoplasmatota archaeon]
MLSASLASGLGVLSALLFVSVLRHALPPEWGMLPVPPVGIAAAVFGAIAWKGERAGWARWLGLVATAVGGSLAAIALLLIIVL